MRVDINSQHLLHADEVNKNHYPYMWTQISIHAVNNRIRIPFI
jgi:hypothetical protein